MAAVFSAQQLREVLHYDKKTGVFTRIVKTGRSVKIGDVAGSKDNDGYLRFRLLNGQYKAHRLAWLYVYGEWPVGPIDHIDGNRANNAITNLRNVSHSVNSQNQRRAHARNANGFLGVTRSGNRWLAKIMVDGALIRLGVHDTPELAASAYLSAKRELHPGCSI